MTLSPNVQDRTHQIACKLGLYISGIFIKRVPSRSDELPLPLLLEGEARLSGLVTPHPPCLLASARRAIVAEKDVEVELVGPGGVAVKERNDRAFKLGLKG